MPVTLYHFAPSAPSRSSLLTARALKLDVDVKIVNLFTKEQLKPEFIAINPQHCIPTLKDDDFVLWESRAINSYLVNKYAANSDLYPQSDTRTTATINRLLYFDAGSLYPAIRAICFPVLFMGETKISKDKRDKLNEVFAHLNTFLEGCDWVAKGSNYTIADIAIAASVSSIVAVGWNLTPFPNVKKWFDKCCATLPGYEENKEGAEIFGNAVSSKLDKGEI
ncbi:glutathione S-transferase 1-like [Arctopsyche grandis]|uniref:glutathione S-transferase 1-like n=1 Tax=Arctopsyche grandis TaxID=121162 RepID=UPI00406DA384